MVAQRTIAIAFAALTCLLGVSPALAQCGPTDVVFVVDTTGSMGGVLDNVKAELPSIIAQIQAASGGDYRLGLLEFGTQVIVDVDLAGGNLDAIQSKIKGLVASGGDNEPEASDEALKTVIHGLKASDRAAGQQVGDFNGRFRDGASRIIILITDARPGGFHDSYTPGVDDVSAAQAAKDAAAAGIHISAVYVPDFDSFAETIRAIMRGYASVTDGFYLEANKDGTGTAAAINDIISKCGGTTFSTTGLVVDPPEIAVSNGDSADVKVVNYLPGDLKTLFYTSDMGLPTDSTVVITPQTAEVPLTDQRRMRITIGPDTQAGLYVVGVTASHTDGGQDLSGSVLVVVDCVPPMILSMPGHQPADTTADASGRATLTVKPDGTPGFRYQWYFGHTGFTSFPIAGATSSTLTTPPVTSPTEFWVSVSNACGSADSTTATVRPR